MEATISILDILNILKKRWRIILLTTLCAVLISSTVSYFLLTPVYQTSTQILVNQKNEENQLNYTLLKSNIDLINTYSVIIKSPVILEKVIDKLDLKQNVEELNKNISISSQENSQVFSLTVKDPDAAMAVKIANTLSETFQQEIKGIMNVDNVSILAKAELKENPAPVSPRPLLNIAIAVVIGLMIGIGISFLLELMDNSIKNDQDVEKYLGLPVLGTIQEIPQKKDKKNHETQNVRSETIVSSVEK